MSTLALPPNPSLVAIILIARTRKGVKRIFHHPPNPGKEKVHIKYDHEDSSGEESPSSSDDDGYSSVEDDEPQGGDHHHRSKHHYHHGHHGHHHHRNGATELDESGSVSPEKAHGDRDAWHHGREGPTEKRTKFLSLPYGFERLLCPPAATSHKKRFEMSINGLTFLGWPVFARENGEWRRRRKSRGPREKSRRMSTISEQQVVGGKETMDGIENAIAGEIPGLESTEDDDYDVIAEAKTRTTAAEDDGMVAMQEDDETEDTLDDKTRKAATDLSMFHVVFVMNPPPLEYQLRVDEMYKYVVKKFSRALKWEQARSGYVQKECDRLKTLKAKHEASSENAIRNSSLARAIAAVYASIATSRIAHVELTTHLSFSLQIPTLSSISHLPDLVSPQLPGLWLTTSTNIASNEDVHATRSKLASHFALLLLSDLSTILSDIAATSSPLSAPLANYLRHSTPRKSFLQISQTSGISLADIQFLASHLIYWRRARAVPPLHQRDTYIVSPNADMRKLRSATHQYAKLFPAQLPSLLKMLSLLSAGPRPFNALIPSKDHKPIYFEVLAWLLRGGWVTQLRTFAWVRVPAAIQAGVAREEAEMAAETEAQEAAAAAAAAEGERRARDERHRYRSRDRLPPTAEHARATGSGHGSGTDTTTTSPTSSARSNRSSLGASMSLSMSSGGGSGNGPSGSHDPGEPDLPSGTLSPPHFLRSSRSHSSRASSQSSFSSARTAIPLDHHAHPHHPHPLSEHQHQHTSKSHHDNHNSNSFDIASALSGATLSSTPTPVSHPAPTSVPYTSATTTARFSSPDPMTTATSTSALTATTASVAPIEAFTPLLLLAPTRASGRESRYLAHIARALEASEGRECREAWERCLKYFNGEHALEKIAMREGWKRKKVEGLRGTWTRLGVLAEVRHW